MGHYCWMCERLLPNERFSGHGHKQHLCRDCQKLPVNVRLLKQTSSELRRFLHQANISKRNIKRLKQILATPELKELFPLTSVILKIATVKPHRKKRFSFIKWNHPELWKQMIAVEIVEFRYAEDTTEDPEPFIYEEDSIPDVDRCFTDVSNDDDFLPF